MHSTRDYAKIGELMSIIGISVGVTMFLFTIILYPQVQANTEAVKVIDIKVEKNDVVSVKQDIKDLKNEMKNDRKDSDESIRLLLVSVARLETKIDGLK